MSIYTKLRTLMRVSIDEPIRHITEKNDLRIFEQEVRDAQQLIKQTKLQLAGVKSEIRLLKESISSLTQSNTLREQQIDQALGKDEELARDLATLLAEDEMSLSEHQANLKQLNKLDERITRNLKTALQSVKSHQNQLAILKINEQSMRVSDSANQSAPGIISSIAELNESLKAIKHRQLRARFLDDAHSDVEESISGMPINQRLKVAGIKTGEHDADIVLDRIRRSKH
jgi:phage shock protein A